MSDETFKRALRLMTAFFIAGLFGWVLKTLLA